MFVAIFNNPNATTFDLMSNDINPENTSLYNKDDYKNTKFVQDRFKTEDGKFDDLAFNNFYNLAANRYQEMTNDDYLKSLNEVQYSPFDITRPAGAKVFKVDVEYSKDFNPYRQLYSRTAINSIDESEFSLRELAQQERIFDPRTNTWSKSIANDIGLIDKLFGDTLVYAQWDEDGVHSDPESGRVVNHKKGDWKVNENGNLFLEKLAGREIYGKQVVNPTDMLTTDGSFANKFDFMDSDSREKSVGATAFKLAVEIAPLLIPGVGLPYGGIKAAIGLASVLPTFYKSFESLLMGDNKSPFSDTVTAAEGWMAKFNQRSLSDEGSESLLGIESMGTMVADIFSQLYEQRAAAWLSKIIMKADKVTDKATQEMALKINRELIQDAIKGKIDFKDVPELSKFAMQKIPQVKAIIDKQSQLSKALSLGYMALISTNDIYGQAIQGGYDRRTAGFAALVAAAGQYGIMMNNRMGDWFLDETTGYTTQINKSLVRQSVLPWLDEIKEVFDSGKNVITQRAGLAGVVRKMKGSIDDFFMTPAVAGKAIMLNAFREGMEEVTEQAVLDSTKWMIDVMSYLGLTEKKGSFETIDNLISKQGFETYLANFVGGVLGGAMFEFQRSVIAPWTAGGKISQPTRKSIYEIVAAGQKQDLIDVINKQKYKFGNKYLSAVQEEGNYLPSQETKISQADLIAEKAIGMIEVIDGIMNSHDLVRSDEEIVRKAIRDKIVINALEKTKPEGKNIGLEGLILKDYKDSMAKIVDIETMIKNLETNEDNKEQIAIQKKQLKIHIDNINDILDGKKSMKYFDEINMYLNSKINKSFLLTDRNTYTRAKYKVDFNSLPKTGLGLTQEGITKEWMDSVNSKDLVKELEVATNAYKELELLLNDSIAKYTESGYDIVRKDTFNKILDIKETINLFNTSTDQETKVKALEKFIAINNQLDAIKQSKVAPWDVYNNDIYDQLNDLGLIKKVIYTPGADGKIVSTLENFTKQELDEIVPGLNITNAQQNKNIIQDYFKTFPLNPLNAEMIIDNLNGAINKFNLSILEQIETINQKPDKTEEDVAKLNTLPSKLIKVNIGTFEDTTQILTLRQATNDEILRQKVDSDISDDVLREYANIRNNPAAYEKTFDQLVSDIYNKTKEESTTDIDNWESLNRVQIAELLQKLSNLGILNEIKANLQGVDNVSEVIDSIIAKLPTDITEEEYAAEIKPILDQLFTLAQQIIDSGFNIKNNQNVKDLVDFIETKTADLEKEINKVKPNILKIHNYAFELLIKELAAGNADKEVYLEAKKLFDGEVTTIKGIVFPGMSNLSNEDFITLITNAQQYAGIMSSIYGLIDQEQDIDTLEKLLANPAFDFEDENLKRIVVNSFDGNTDTVSIAEIFVNVEDQIKKYKSNLERINKFIELQAKGLNLKSNTLYDFIRNFALSLNSNPKSKVNKIFEILEREEISIKAAPNITSYTADNIREQDINQAINTLEMIKSVVYAMSTTEVDYEDPVGFISARQIFAKRNGIKDPVTSLKTITSDVATLMIQDLDNIITKLNFIKELSQYNAGKITNEQELIRTQMGTILLEEWKDAIKKLNPALFPTDKISEILASKDNNDKKLMDIEDTVFESSKNRQLEVFEEILKNLENVNSSDYSKIDKDVTRASIKSWDLAVYYATIIATKSKDFHIRSLITINGSFSKAPFYTQELAARVVKASTVNPLLFSKIFEMKKDSTKFPADFITIVIGGAGVGKTTAVLGLDLDNFRQTNDNTNIWLSAPNTDQVKNLHRAISDSVGEEKLTLTDLSKTELFEKLGIKTMIAKIEAEIKDPYNAENTYIHIVDRALDITLPEGWENEVDFKNLPNLLLIDEITHYSFAELTILNAISKLSYNKDSTNFMKIVGAGDPTQLGYLAKVDNLYYSYNIDAMNAIFTPRLWTTVRSANNQKRENNETFNEIVNKLTSIYKELNGEPELATTKAIEFLKNVNTITGLNYHISDTQITGDIILKNYDKSLFLKLKKIIDSNPEKSIGILTNNGSIDSKLNDILSEVGLINADGTHPNIKIFTPENIQGNEVNYFIFSSDFITLYDKVRDNLKAFYTYISRSIDGSIILDEKNTLESEFDITQAKQTEYPTRFEPLTKEVIAKAKERRVNDLNTLLGNDPKVSSDDNFKWKIGSEEINVIPIEDSVEVKPVDTLVDYTTDDKLHQTQEKKKVADILSKVKISAKSFKFMFHSFYNNPNAKIANDKSKITVNPDNTNTDLNLISDVSGEKEVKQIIENWTKLKNFAIHNLKTIEGGTISSKGFKNYLKHIFTESSDFENDQNLKTELVLTGTKFDTSIHIPFAKHGLEEELLLKDGEPFLNLSLKITFGDAIHYVTLATLGKQKTIENWINKNVTNDSDKSNLLSKVDSKFTQISKALDSSEDNTTPLEFGNLSASQIEFITSTRLVKIKDTGGELVKHTLTELSEKFPGMNYSEIRMFPGDFNTFKNLINKYNFGETRSEERIKKLWERLANKPYIVVSFANDLDGNSLGNTSAKLIPIGSTSRSFKTLTEEIAEIRKEIADEINKEFEAKLAAGETEENIRISKSVKVSDAFNAKAETLLNRSQILDILITWANTKYGEETLLDLLSKEITFTAADKIFNKSHSILQVLNNFRGGNDTTLSKLNSIIENIKASIKEIKGLSSDQLKKAVESYIRRKTKLEGDALDNAIKEFFGGSSTLSEDKLNQIVKDTVIEKSKGFTGWHWNFYNLFAYQSIIDKKAEKDFLNLISHGTLNVDAVLNDKEYQVMKDYISELMKPISSIKFFYSLPIKPGLIVNPLINGTNGFNKEFFGDKFYINVAPESERALVDLSNFFNSSSLIIKQEKKQIKESREEKFNQERKDLLSLYSKFEDVVFAWTEGTFDFNKVTKEKINFINEYINKLNELLTSYSDTINAQDKTFWWQTTQQLKNIVKAYSVNITTNDPITSFINDAVINNVLDDETVEVISPFEDLRNMIVLLKEGEPGVLISEQTLTQLIKSFQETDTYINNKNSIELVRAFFGDGALNIAQSAGGLTYMDLFKKLIDASANKDLKKKIIDYTKSIVEKINKCK